MAFNNYLCWWENWDGEDPVSLSDMRAVWASWGEAGPGPGCHGDHREHRETSRAACQSNNLTFDV